MRNSDLSKQAGESMTNPLELIKEAREMAEQASIQRKNKLSEFRRVASAHIKKQLISDLIDSGTNVSESKVMSWVDSYVEMYELISYPSDVLNQSNKTNHTSDEINDLFIEWIHDSRVLIWKINPAFSNKP